jgi:hypothetical protein
MSGTTRTAWPGSAGQLFAILSLVKTVLCHVKNPGALELLEHERNNPRSLARLSRTAVRSSLSVKNCKVLCLEPWCPGAAGAGAEQPAQLGQAQQNSCSQFFLCEICNVSC